MGLEAEFQEMGVEVTDQGKVLQMGTRFESEEDREGVEGEGQAVHLGVKLECFVG